MAEGQKVRVVDRTKSAEEEKVDVNEEVKEGAQEEAKQEAESKEKTPAERDAEFMEGFPGLQVDEMIVKGWISHDFKIHEKFRVKLRTLSQEETLDIDKRTIDYRGSDAFLINSVCADILTYSLESINGEPMTLVRPTSFKDDDAEKVFEEKFGKKRERIKKLSDVIFHMTHDRFKELQKASVILFTGDSSSPLAHRLLGHALT